MRSLSSPGSISVKKLSALAAAGFLGLGLSVAGCGRDREPAQAATPVVDAPPGTALLVDDVPVTAAEVERWATWIELVEPQYVPDARRRFALTNGLLERAALEAARPELRLAAKARADAAAVLLAADPDAALIDGQHQTVEGTWQTIGIQLFGELQPETVDEWVGPIERVGTFTLARVRAITTQRDHRVLEVDFVEYPFVAPETARADVATALDDARLTIVDQAYSTLVPEAWKYRMDGPDR